MYERRAGTITAHTARYPSIRVRDWPKTRLHTIRRITNNKLPPSEHHNNKMAPVDGPFSTVAAQNQNARVKGKGPPALVRPLNHRLLCVLLRENTRNVRPRGRLLTPPCEFSRTLSSNSALHACEGSLFQTSSRGMRFCYTARVGLFSAARALQENFGQTFGGTHASR